MIQLPAVPKIPQLNSWKRILEQTLSQCVKRNEDRHFVETSVILYSDDGTAYRLLVANNGALSTEKV